MGCDIHCFLEEYDEQTKKWDLSKDCIEKDSYREGNRAKDFWDDRSYWTFAWLGCNYRAKSIQYINAPRGLPEDVSETLKQLEGYWILENDGHNYSHFYFDELLEYFEVPVYCKAEFSPEYLAYLKREGKEVWQDPDWYKNIYGTVEKTWTMPVEEVVNNDFINKVKEKAKGRNPKHLRIVFWFDN